MKRFLFGAAVAATLTALTGCSDRPERVEVPEGSDVADVAVGGSHELLDGEVTVAVAGLDEKDGDDAARVTVEVGRDEDTFTGARGDRLTVGDVEIVVLDVDTEGDGVVTIAAAPAR